MMGGAEKMQRCHDYVEALEEERRKIQVFRRELPLCLELVTQAIETCKSQLSPAATTTELVHERSECSEHTTSGNRPVLEEFIPIKRVTTTSSGDEEVRRPDADKTKSDWLRSAQLWNQSPDPEIKYKEAAAEVKRNGGGFQPSGKSNGCKTASFSPATATSSSAETDNKEEKERDEQGQRKQRRCWSPELHRRFLHALQQLGGSHTATPKQIRELMKVEGLTNDEVKSHLQKYRLHTRRPSSRIHNGSNQQAPQFLVVGGIWMPPTDYAPAAAPPLLAAAPRPSRPQSEKRRSHMHSHSPSTSSSTHTHTVEKCV